MRGVGSKQRFLVTGALGCIGAWSCALLAAEVSRAEVAASIERAVPGVAVEVDEETHLPFPEDFDGRALEQLIGPIDWTPLDEGIAETIQRLRASA